MKLTLAFGALCLGLLIHLAPTAMAAGNGITLYVETVPDNPALKTSVQTYLRQKSEQRHPRRGLVRFVDRWDGNALVLRLEKLSAKMSESDRRSTVYTLHDDKVDGNKRDTFPRGSKVELDLVVSRLTTSYVYKLQMVVDGAVWDAATLEMPNQTLDYEYGEHLRVVGTDGQVTRPPKGAYPNAQVAQFLRHGDRNYVDQMWADGLGKAAVHLVSGYFGPINAALRNAPFDDLGTRDGILFAERFRRIATLIGQVRPAAEECEIGDKVAGMKANLLKGVRGLSGGRMPLGLGVPADFPGRLERMMKAETSRIRSTRQYGNGCTRDVEQFGVPLLNELGDEVEALNAAMGHLGDLN